MRRGCGKVLKLIATGAATAYIGTFATRALMTPIALISIYLVASFVLSLRESPNLSGIAYLIGMALGHFVLGDTLVFIIGSILAVAILLILIIAETRRTMYIDPLVELYTALSLLIVIPVSALISILAGLDAELIVASIFLAIIGNILANTIIYRDIAKKLRKRIAKTFRENGYTAVENMLGFRVHGRTMCYVVRAEKIREGTINIDTIPRNADTIIDAATRELRVPHEALRLINFQSNDKRYIALAILVHTNKQDGKEVLTATILSLPHKVETITMHQP